MLNVGWNDKTAINVANDQTLILSGAINNGSSVIHNANTQAILASGGTLTRGIDGIHEPGGFAFTLTRNQQAWQPINEPGLTFYVKGIIPSGTSIEFNLGGAMTLNANQSGDAWRIWKDFEIPTSGDAVSLTDPAKIILSLNAEIDGGINGVGYSLIYANNDGTIASGVASTLDIGSGTGYIEVFGIRVPFNYNLE